MQWINSTARYGAVSQFLHWSGAAFVIAAWLLGQFGDDLPKAAQSGGLFAHMTLGLGVLLILFARLGWRLFSPPPPPEPTRFGRPLAVAANVMTVAIWLLLLAVPVLGIMVQFGRGHDLPILGLWSISFAVAGRPDVRPHRCRASRIAGEYSDDPRRAACRSRSRASQYSGRSHAHPHAARPRPGGAS